MNRETVHAAAGPGGRKTERKVQLGFALAVVLLAAVSLASYGSLRRLLAHGAEVKRAEVFIDGLHEVLLGITESETAQRGYIITGLSFYLEAFDEVERSLPERVTALRRRGAELPEIASHLEEIERLVKDRLVRARETIEIRRHEGLAPAQARLVAGIGKAMIEDIKAHVRAVEEQADARLVASERRANRSAEQAERVVVSAGLVALIVVGLAMWVVRRDFAGARRADAALREAQADLERRVGQRTAELAQANAALRESEARVVSIVENMTEGLVVTDLEGRLLQTNPAARAMLALTGGEGPGTNVARIREAFELRDLAGAPVPVAEWPMARIRRGERLHELEVRVRRAGQAERIFSYSGSLVRQTGGEALAFVAITDVTAKREAEEALRTSEMKFARAFANNPAAIALTHLEDGRVIEVNDTWVELTGYERAEIVGRTARMIWPTPEAAARFVAELREAGVVREMEQEFHGRKGAFIAQLSSVRLSLGGEAVVLSTLVDVTARKRAEEAREQERRRVVLLAEVSRRLVTTEAPRAVLRSILGAIVEELGIDIYANYFLTGNGRLRLESAAGLTEAQIAAFAEIAVGESLCGLVAQRGSPLKLADLSTQELPQAAGIVALGVTAYAGFPLFAGGELIGTVSFGSRRRTAYAAGELQMLEAAADQISAAMERARLLGELRRSEQRHRMLYNTMLQGVVYHDAAGAVATMNPAARRMLALGEEAVGMSLAAVAEHMVRDGGGPLGTAEHPAAEALRAAGEIRDRTLGWRRPGGELRWMNVSALPQFADGGARPTGVFVILDDVTERRRAEETLRQHEALLREMGRLAQVGGWAFDVATGEGYWTEEVARIHDLPLDAKPTKEVGLRHYPASVRPTITAAINRAIAEGVPYDLELPFDSASGRRKWVRTIGHPVYEAGRVVRLSGSFQEVTDRKRAERRLATQAAVSRGLAEAGTLVEAAARVLEAICEAENWQFGAFWALDPAAGRLRAVAIWQQPGLDTAELAQATRALSLGKGEGLPGVAWETRAVKFMPDVMTEGRFVRREAAARAGLRSALGFPVIIDQEVAGAVDFLAADLHEEDARLGEMFEMIGRQVGLFLQRRRAEEEVRRMNAELEQRVQHRTAELEAANKELEAFSYSVSHDLRAPLRAVDGFSRIVIEDYGPQLPAEAQHYLENVARGAQQMGTLIDDLLTFSRLSRLPLHRAEIDTAELVAAVLQDLAPMQAGRQVAIRCGPLPPSLGDQALLRQVWINLLANALKYTRRRPAAEIDIAGRELGGEVEFSVRDNGAGFDMRYADKLFGVFQRLHRSEDYEGTGVGLAIVQRIVHRHGGRVWAEAAVDRGATFYFTLHSKDS